MISPIEAGQVEELYSRLCTLDYEELPYLLALILVKLNRNHPDFLKDVKEFLYARGIYRL